MENSAREFHMEEYRQLRTEVTGLLSRIELLFRYALLAVATVSAWLLANSMSVTQPLDPCVKLPKALLYFGWSIPPIFVVCSGLMANITNVRVRQIGEYLTKLEERLGAADLGWERDLSKKESILTNTTTRLWWGLFAFSAIASGVGLVTIFLATGSCPVTK